MAETRAPRIDRGRVRCTPRDEEALRFLWQQRAVWEADLAVLLGRLSGGRPLAELGVASVVRRWQRAGWVRVEKPWTARPRHVTLTPVGAAMVGDETDARPPSDVRLLHSLSISRARLWLGGQEPWGPLIGWRSEREIRREHFADGAVEGHVPDGLADFEGLSGVCVEVELSPKSRQSLEAILAEVTLAYPHSIYFAGEAIGRNVLEAYRRLTEAGRAQSEKLTVLPLPEAAS